MQNNRRQTGFRLSEKADEILDKFSNDLGISKNAIVELALREFQEKRENNNGQKEIRN